jgi:hypothetical protein
MGWDDGIELTSIGPKGSSDAALQLDGNQPVNQTSTHMYKGGKKGARKIRVCLTHTRDEMEKNEREEGRKKEKSFGSCAAHVVSVGRRRPSFGRVMLYNPSAI